jgi:tetratricopeptide (TPR) repeat protein
VSWAAVVLNRPNALPFAVLLMLGAWWRGGRRRGAPMAAVYVVGLGVLMAPAALRNLRVTGDLVLVASHGGFNFFVGNNADADGTYRSVAGVTPSSVRQAADARRVAEAAAGRPLTDGEVSGYFYRRAGTWIASAPADALALLLKKIRYVVSADEISLNYSYAYYRHDERSVLMAMPVGPWLLLPLGLVGLAACAPKGGDYRVWAGFVPVYAISVAVFFVSDRYRLPLLVPLAASSGALVARALALASAGAWRRLAVGTAAVAAAATLTWWPTGLDDGRGEERVAMAESLIRRGEVAAGQALIDRALPEHRQPALLLFRAGRALQAASHIDAAITRYEQALGIEPGRPEIRYFLGECLLGQRRVADAIPHLDAAVTAAVRLDVAPFDLARALASTGDREAARRALGRLAIPEQADTASFAVAGQLAERLADAPLAIRFYAAALERPDAPVAMLERLGVLLAMDERSREAVSVLDRAVSRHPREPSLHLNLAVALAQDGRLPEARASVAEALRLRPDYPQARALAARLSR